MALDIANCLELQQLLLLDANTETGVGLDQNFVEPQGVDPDVLHQARITCDDRRICAGNAMQDLDKAYLQLLLIGDSLCQHPHPFDQVKVPASLRSSLAPVPAELLVDGLVVNVDEERQAIFRQLRKVGGHQDFSDLIEIPRQR